MPVWLREFFGDRIQVNSLLIVLCFVSVLALSSQSAASYPSYLLAISMALSISRWHDVFRTQLLWIIVALLGYLCLSSFWSDPFSWRETAGIFARGLLVFTFVVAMAECQLRGDVQLWLGRTLAIAGFIAAVAAMVAYGIEPPADGRLSGLGQLDNSVVVGLIFGAVLILLVEIVIADPVRIWRLLAIAGAITVGLAIYLSGSRNAWISAFVGMLVLVFSSRIRDPQRFVAAFLALLVVLAVMLVALLGNESGRDLLLPRGDSFRLDIWAEVFERVMAHAPLFGLGIATPDQVTLEGLTFSHPHSMYLATYFQGGVLAFSLFLAVIVASLLHLFGHYAERSAKLALGLMTMALTSYLFDGHELVDKVGETWFLFWLPVGISLGLSWSRAITVGGLDND